MDRNVIIIGLLIFFFLVIPLFFLGIFTLLQERQFISIAPIPAPGFMDPCNSELLCQAGLTCSYDPNSDASYCLVSSGGLCLNNSQCASRNCANGTCQNNNVTQSIRRNLFQTAIPSRETMSNNQLAYYDGNSWRNEITLPTPMKFITASQTHLVGIGEKDVFLYQNQRWDNLTNMIINPGKLITASVYQDRIYLIYERDRSRLIYFIEGNQLQPFGKLAGSQLSTTDEVPIWVEQLSFHPNGNSYLVGRDRNYSTIYFSTTEGYYQASVTGNLVTANPRRNSDQYVFADGKTIFVLPDRRIDTNGTVTSLVVYQDQVWYVVNGKVYREKEVISTPRRVKSLFLYQDRLYFF